MVVHLKMLYFGCKFMICNHFNTFWVKPNQAFRKNLLLVIFLYTNVFVAWIDLFKTSYFGVEFMISNHDDLGVILDLS